MSQQQTIASESRSFGQDSEVGTGMHDVIRYMPNRPKKQQKMEVNAHVRGQLPV